MFTHQSNGNVSIASHGPLVMIIDRIPFRSGEEFRTLYDPLLPQSFTEDRTETEEGPYAVTLNEWRYTLYSVPHPSAALCAWEWERDTGPEMIVV